MASEGYNTKKLEKQSLEAIDKHRLFFMNDIPAFLPCSRATFYNHGLDKLDTIKEALERNRIEVKSSMRSKWYKSSNPTVQIALYKLIADEEERKKISQGYTDITTDGEKLPVALVKFIGGEKKKGGKKNGDNGNDS